MSPTLPFSDFQSIHQTCRDFT